MLFEFLYDFIFFAGVAFKRHLLAIILIMIIKFLVIHLLFHSTLQAALVRLESVTVIFQVMNVLRISE